MCHYFHITRQAVHQYITRQTDRELYYRELIEQSRAIRSRHPRMGAKIIYRILRPKQMGRERFEQLLMGNGFRVRRVKNYLKTTDSNGWMRYRNLVAGTTLTDINQVWTSDITYLISKEGTVYYVITLMDLYSRRIIGYAASTNLKAEQTSMKALKMALACRSIKHYPKLTHHSDRGSQYRYQPYIDLLSKYHIQLSMCREVYDNAHQERLNGTIKNEYLIFLNTSSLKNLQASLKQTVIRYNEEKPHSALNYRTPVDYEHYLEQTPIQNHPLMNIYSQSSDTNQQNQKKAKEKRSKKENLPSSNNYNNKLS